MGEGYPEREIPKGLGWVEFYCHGCKRINNFYFQWPALRANIITKCPNNGRQLHSMFSMTKSVSAVKPKGLIANKNWVCYTLEKDLWAV